MPSAPDQQEPITRTTPDGTPTLGSPEEQAVDGEVWQDEQLSELHQRDDKAEKVQAMFGAIADSYDLNNRVHSLWRDEAWRKVAVRMAGVTPGESVLDMACGTGDLTQAFARMTKASEIVGGDFTPEMLDLARHKQERLADRDKGRIEYVAADAMNLQFEDNRFDVISIAFGIRNVQRPDAALAEFYRVLKPGGRLVILEFDKPRFPPMRWFNDFYCGQVMPRTATWISRDRSGAYRYLPKSVSGFMDRDELAGAMGTAGFGSIRQKVLTMGICVCSVGVKPGLRVGQ